MSEEQEENRIVMGQRVKLVKGNEWCPAGTRGDCLRTPDKDGWTNVRFDAGPILRIHVNDLAVTDVTIQDGLDAADRLEEQIRADERERLFAASEKGELTGNQILAEVRADERRRIVEAGVNGSLSFDHLNRLAHLDRRNGTKEALHYIEQLAREGKL